MKKEVLISVFDMEIGGIERSLINMLESFDYENYNVSLFVCSHQGEFMNLIPRQVHLLPEIGAYTVFRKSVAQCLRERRYSAALVRILAKSMASIKARRRRLVEGPGYIQMQLESRLSVPIIPSFKKEYDLAISYAWPHEIVIRKVRAKKKVAWIHTDYSKLEIDNQLDLAGWRKFDRIASISDACTQSFLFRYPELRDKIVPIENITSPGFIRSQATEPLHMEISEGPFFNIVSVGRLSFVKGFDTAIQALKILHEAGLTDIRWYVVGYGGQKDELRTLIADNNLQESFKLIGKKSNPYPYIQRCDLYVQPSRYEGKAVTVTEAQILGKPIVITNYPTSTSQVTNGLDGIICEGSPEGIAEAIKRMYTDSELRESLTNYLKEKNHSNDSELIKLYDLIPS
ncbi:glycosyltransferase [Cohnella soli]|uniref:Glycosyltransferase n=1 Tax=Cohnella soli TaxID=425005 RepID=A0ABW0HZW8_9BACL